MACANINGRSSFFSALQLYAKLPAHGLHFNVVAPNRLGLALKSLHISLKSQSPIGLLTH